MASISFAHFASTSKQLATEQIIKQVRSLYPDTYYFVASDAVDDHTQLAKDYNLDFHLFNKKLGYPVQPYGYRAWQISEWLRRLHIACANTNTSHIIMMEDDVWVKQHITVKDHWEIAAHELNPDGKGNAIDPGLIEVIELFANRRPLTHQYASGGGSIFRVQTFLDNFERINAFFLEHTNNIQEHIYPTIGWIDCFMTVYYMLAGKDYTINSHLADTHNHRDGFDYDAFLSKLPEHTEIINNYKKWYWV